jgi:cytochrome c peroxidase
VRDGRTQDAAQLLDAREVAGLRLFIDPARTQCLQCHNGPQLTNGGFHNLGTGTFTGAALDFGRALGIQGVLLDAFNCVGRYSDARSDDCRELRFLSTDAHVPLEGAFKTPTLRDVREDGALPARRPLRDAARGARLLQRAAGRRRTRAARARARRPELDDLERFLRALSGGEPKL